MDRVSLLCVALIIVVVVVVVFQRADLLLALLLFLHSFPNPLFHSTSFPKTTTTSYLQQYMHAVRARNFQAYVSI